MPQTTVRASAIGTAASGTAVSVARPTGTVAGDLVFVVVHCNNLTTIVDNNGATPFTEDLNDFQNATTSHTVSLFSRRILAGDPATYNFTLGTSQRWTAVAVAFQNPHPSTIYDVAASTASAANGTGAFSVPSISPTTTYAIHCSIFCADFAANSITGTPAGYTVEQNGGDQDIAFATKVWPVPGPTGTTRWVDALDDGKIGISFAIKDIAGVAATGTYPLTGSAPASLEARLHAFRLGQSRLGYMNPTLRLMIGGTERQNEVDKKTVLIQRSAESPTTASFTALDFEPIEGQEVIIGVGSITNVVFAGHIVKVALTTPVHQGLGRIRYSVQCQDYSWKFNQKKVQRQYGSDNVESILNDLVNNFTTGFTCLHVNGGLGFLTGPTPFTMEDPDLCVRRLAREVGAYSYIDHVKDLHFFAAGQDRAPQPHDLTTSFDDFEQVRYSADTTQIKTRIYVEGAGTTLTTAYAGGSSMAVADTSMFPQAGQFDIRIGSYAPVYVALAQRRLRVTVFDATTLTVASVGTDVSPYADLLGMLPFPIGTTVNLWRVVEDTAAQTALAALDGGDGVRDDYVQDRRLGYTGMLERGQAELERKAPVNESLSYQSHDPNSRPGAIVTVNIPINLPTPTTLTGSFTIQGVTISDIETARNRHPWYRVSATSHQRSLFDLLQHSLLKAA